MRWLELKVPPVLTWLIFAAAMFGLARATPGLSWTVTGTSIIAAALVATGLVTALLGVLAFRDMRTTVNPLTPDATSAVVSRGVYRVSRNPMYLGFVLALAGWAVCLSNALAATAVPAFVAYMTQFQIKPEERALLAKFGTEFAQYMSRVRRWL
jgi:protein-S-isoprenylcysteine O-methyltransferase Ste14